MRKKAAVRARRIDATPVQVRDRTVDGALSGPREWRIVRTGDVYSLRRVLLLEGGRVVGLGDSPRLTSSDVGQLCTTLAEIASAGEANVLQADQLLEPEYLERAQFIIQQYQDWSDYPEWDDLLGDDQRPIAFPTEALAQAYINEMIDHAFALNLARHQREQEDLRHQTALYEARRALLVANDLWDEDAMNGFVGFDRRAPVRDTGEGYRVVPLEQSDWYNE